MKRSELTAKRQKASGRARHRWTSRLPPRVGDEATGDRAGGSGIVRGTHRGGESEIRSDAGCRHRATRARGRQSGTRAGTLPGAGTTSGRAHRNWPLPRRRSKPDDAATANAVAAAEKKVADAATALAAAHAALAEPSAKYQPLGEQLPHQSTGRRLAFANWIVDRKNPLAARVAINHIWLRHFGAPLVDNMFDFGLRTPQPRNQPLLDWLAVELMDHGWQMKHIHRLLVTSNAYRMASGTAGASAANLRTRSRQPLPVADEYAAAGSRSGPRRRVLYRRQSGPHARRAGYRVQAGLRQRRAAAFTSSTPTKSKIKFLELFDGASVNECYRRSESVVPQQALALANSDVSLNESRLLAKQAERARQQRRQSRSRRSCDSRSSRFSAAIRRPPNCKNAETFLESQAELLRRPEQTHAVHRRRRKRLCRRRPIPVQRARENLTLVLFNHNDFVTIRLGADRYGDLSDFNRTLAAACLGERSWPTSAWASPAWRSARCSIATASPATPLAGRRPTACRISRRRPRASSGCS